MPPRVPYLNRSLTRRVLLCHSSVEEAFEANTAQAKRWRLLLLLEEEFLLEGKLRSD
ncbi:hypothetical protein L916_03704 [Phytophthora nicotianae]|uniref:Uncharacterized protein n=2 Tax=Phytophthora nicotianae TaxID=4792 RepID=W2JIX0_PHYNI|nr:hypothetical protein L916_03705 [Phytophthora nicotianae]ETL46405.1 hypothetical protein L916_03704 [Phytophthora nicotianae]ETO81807.1 hypothetical protein F444_03954 [Phytophthora nicotianae P1976]